MQNVHMKLNAIAKLAFKKKTLVTSKFGLNLGKKPMYATDGA